MAFLSCGQRPISRYSSDRFNCRPYLVPGLLAIITYRYWVAGLLCYHHCSLLCTNHMNFILSVWFQNHHKEAESIIPKTVLVQTLPTRSHSVHL